MQRGRLLRLDITLQRDLSNLQYIYIFSFSQSRSQCHPRVKALGTRLTFSEPPSWIPRTPRNEKQEVCACALVKCEKSCWSGDTLCNGVASCCNLLQKVELSSTSCNASCNKKNCETTGILHCAILRPATCPERRDPNLRRQKNWSGSCTSSCDSGS